MLMYSCSRFLSAKCGFKVREQLAMECKDKNDFLTGVYRKAQELIDSKEVNDFQKVAVYISVSYRTKSVFRYP